MRVHAYYLISAKPSLKRRLRRLGASAELATRSVLVGNPEGGRSVWKPGDHATLVKIAFLVERFRREGKSRSDTFAALFGSADLTPRLFDRWWTMERYEMATETPHLRPWLRDVRQHIPSTGNRHVDSWIEAALAVHSR
jgi:hypothetical protein